MLLAANAKIRNEIATKRSCQSPITNLFGFTSQHVKLTHFQSHNIIKNVSFSCELHAFTRLGQVSWLYDQNKAAHTNSIWPNNTNKNWIKLNNRINIAEWSEWSSMIRIIRMIRELCHRSSAHKFYVHPKLYNFLLATCSWSYKLWKFSREYLELWAAVKLNFYLFSLKLFAERTWKFTFFWCERRRSL